MFFLQTVMGVRKFYGSLHRVSKILEGDTSKDSALSNEDKD